MITCYKSYAVANSALTMTTSVTTAPMIVAAEIVIPVEEGNFVDVSSVVEVEVPHAYNVAICSYAEYTIEGSEEPPVQLTRPMGTNGSKDNPKYVLTAEHAKFKVPNLNGGTAIRYRHICYAASTAFAGPPHPINKYADIQVAVHS